MESNFFFTIVFFWSNLIEVTNLMGCLISMQKRVKRLICQNFGTLLDRPKKSIRPTQEDLTRITSWVQQVLGIGTFLSLPSMVGRSKKATFIFIKDRIWKKINSWRGRFLSKAGNEVMIMSVLQTIPFYVTSVFVIPDGIVNDIEKTMNSFWWGAGGNNKCIIWLTQDKLSCTKKEGSLGFRDLKAFNLTMVEKQG